MSWSNPKTKQVASRAEEALKGLFEKALAGDETAYASFLEQAALVLRGFLLRALRADRHAAEKAEDLVQEVLFAIHKKRDLYKPGMPVVPWIRAIAKHRLIDSIRAERRRPE